MNDDIFIYLIKMPPGIREAVLPCLEGYTIYLDESLSGEELIKEYDHAMEHINNGDFFNDTMSVSEKEMRAHGYR
jgi:hypothetical protein